MTDNEEERGRPRSFSVPTMFMMPFTVKFSGERDSNVSFNDWKENVETWFRMYQVPVESQLDWVLSSLEGEAKREIAILPAEEKDSAQQVFNRLKALYVCPAPASVVRSLFFNCRQQAEESVRHFALRLQECWQRMMVQDFDNITNAEVLKRDQFVAGLRDDGLRREMMKKVALNNSLTFTTIKMEAILLAEVEGGPQLHCSMAGATSNKRPWEEDLLKLKVELKTELSKELDSKVSGLSHSLLQGIREEFQKLQSGDPQCLRRDPPPTRLPVPNRRRGEYDEQGRPICHNCKRPGHIARYCTQPHQQADLN